jgi:hypothetical protein
MYTAVLAEVVQASRSGLDIGADSSHPRLSHTWRPGARLTDIHRKDPAVTDIDIEGMSIPELERLRDAVNQRLLSLRYSNRHTLPELLRMLEELKGALNDQGKEWRSLER